MGKYVKTFEQFQTKEIINKSFNLTAKAIDDVLDCYLSERNYSAQEPWQLEDIERIRREATKLITTNFGFDSMGVITGFENFPNTIKLYRLIELEKESDLKSNDLGRYWTYDESIFGNPSFLDSVTFNYDTNWFKLEATFKKEDIDIIESVWMNCMLGDTEREIRTLHGIKPITFNIKPYSTTL